jgi:hypothetical protein
LGEAANSNVALLVRGAVDHGAGIRQTTAAAVAADPVVRESRV